MQPTVGRILIVMGIDKSKNNGTDVAPAIITRVWGDGSLVNVKILADGVENIWKTSIPVYFEPSECRGYVNNNPGNVAAHWPER